MGFSDLGRMVVKLKELQKQLSLSSTVDRAFMMEAIQEGLDEIEALNNKLNVALLGCSDPKDCIGWMLRHDSATQRQCGRCHSLYNLMHDD